MNDLPPPIQTELALIVNSPVPKQTVPVPARQIIRQTSHRVSPARASERPDERHDQRRQPKRGRHLAPAP